MSPEHSDSGTEGEDEIDMIKRMRGIQKLNNCHKGVS